MNFHRIILYDHLNYIHQTGRADSQYHKWTAYDQHTQQFLVLKGISYTYYQKTDIKLNFPKLIIEFVKDLLFNILLFINSMTRVLLRISTLLI